MKLAYFDCFSGISGDMTLGAFIDLGVPLDWLKAALTRLPLDGFDLTVTSVYRHGIRAQHAVVHAAEQAHSRHYSEILSLIADSDLPESVKDTSLRIFDRIAAAESHIHGCPKEKVHFHEVGGIDAIVDIVGAVLCMEYLKIDTVVSSKIPLGSGFVSCQHGRLPVPAPATVSILKGVPVYGGQVPFELVTPTGAAIIATLAGSFGTLPDLRVEKIGYGAGTRDLAEQPNLLRIITGRTEDELTDRMIMVETCIDDMNPEFYGFLMDRLFEDGAVDVYWVPIYMKKNRPGTMVQVLCPAPKREAVTRRILTETTSLGVRYVEVQRRVLPRTAVAVETSFGTIEVKQVTDPDGGCRLVPEFEACKRIALKEGLPLRVVYDRIVKEAGASNRCPA